MNPEQEYEYWVEKFYTGTMFVPGWNQQIQKALDGLNKEEQEEIEQRLRDLGDRICLEWAKDNAIRKISSKDLMDFGDRIKKAKKNSVDQLRQEIADLNQIVTDRLSD